MTRAAMRQTTTLVLALVLAAVLAAGLGGCAGAAERTVPPELPADLAPKQETYTRLADVLDTHLRRDVLAHWFPRCVDEERGGFHQCFARDWTPKPEPYRFLVHQARQTWTAARVTQYDPALAKEYRPYVAHGLAYLRDVMTDAEHGGPYLRVGLDGKVTEKHGGGKHAYGISFVIYAGATAFAATGDEAALALATDTFRWFDAHAHDDANGGYFEALSREGRPLATAPAAKGRDGIGTPLGYKSMNAHIHLLEAVTALYHAKPDEAVRARLEELLGLVRDRIQVPPGALNYYFTPDWRAVPMHDSFGHDIETAYLMVEASAVLGRPDDPGTWRVARAIVDHALAWGWDGKHGGFYYSGQAFAGAFERFKSWWTQAEGLNVLLLMHERYGGETDRYWKAFCRQLQFIWDHQVDHAHGGWYARVSEDGKSLVSGPDKANPWKAAYHNVRALVETVERLHRLAKEP